MYVITLFASVLPLVLAIPATPFDLSQRQNVTEVITSLNQAVQRIDDYSQGRPCPAGELFQDKCNLCHCAANGLAAACTLMLCPSEETLRKDRAAEIHSWAHIDDYAYGDKCPSGQTFFKGCNLCQCSSSGDLAVCTMIFCFPEFIQPRSSVIGQMFNLPHIDNYIQGNECPANRLFFNRCNICFCDSNGSSAGCTLMQCPFEDKHSSDV